MPTTVPTGWFSAMDVPEIAMSVGDWLDVRAACSSNTFLVAAAVDRPNCASVYDVFGADST